MPKKKITTSIYDPLVVEIDGIEYVQPVVTETMVQAFTRAPKLLRENEADSFTVIAGVVREFFPQFPANGHDVRVTWQIYNWLGEVVLGAISGLTEQESAEGKPETPGET